MRLRASDCDRVKSISREAILCDAGGGLLRQMVICANLLALLGDPSRSRLKRPVGYSIVTVQEQQEPPARSQKTKLISPQASSAVPAESGAAR